MLDDRVLNFQSHYTKISTWRENTRKTYSEPSNLNCYHLLWKYAMKTREGVVWEGNLGEYLWFSLILSQLILHPLEIWVRIEKRETEMNPCDKMGNLWTKFVIYKPFVDSRIRAGSVFSRIIWINYRELLPREQATSFPYKLLLSWNFKKISALGTRETFIF